MNVLIVQGILLAFALVVILMPPYLKLLRRFGFVKRIRVEGPEAHYIKEGTPTMGGLLVIVVVGVVALALDLVDASTFAPLAPGRPPSTRKPSARMSAFTSERGGSV